MNFFWEVITCFCFFLFSTSLLEHLCMSEFLSIFYDWYSIIFKDWKMVLSLFIKNVNSLLQSYFYFFLFIFTPTMIFLFNFIFILIIFLNFFYFDLTRWEKKKIWRSRWWDLKKKRNKRNKRKEKSKQKNKKCRWRNFRVLCPCTYGFKMEV